MPRQSGDTRERILRTAIELFSQHGFAATTLRDVADRLGVTPAALYYHFPSKEALLCALVEPFLDDVDSLLAEAARGSGPVEALRHLLSRYFDLVVSCSAVVRIVQHDPAVLHSSEVGERFREQRSRLQRAVGGRGRKGRVAGAAVIGTLCRPILDTEGIDVALHRDMIIDAALAALAAVRGTTM